MLAKEKEVFTATNLKVRVLALKGSSSSRSSLGSDASSLASVSGSSRCFPTPSLSKASLSYRESSLHCKIDDEPPYDPKTLMRHECKGSDFAPAACICIKSLRFCVVAYLFASLSPLDAESDVYCITTCIRNLSKLARL